jgi:hypothetical protein
MSEAGMDTYLNDHLAGAASGSELAEWIRDRADGTKLGEIMGSIAEQTEQDRQSLTDLMERMGVTRSPVKQAAGWIAEKVGQVKFSGVASGDDVHGTFMALESLTLGVAGKACLWKALKEVEDEYPPLAATDLDSLIARAESQRSTLERERLAASRRALG